MVRVSSSSLSLSVLSISQVASMVRGIIIITVIVSVIYLTGRLHGQGFIIIVIVSVMVRVSSSSSSSLSVLSISQVACMFRGIVIIIVIVSVIYLTGRLHVQRYRHHHCHCQCYLSHRSPGWSDALSSMSWSFLCL